MEPLRFSLLRCPTRPGTRSPLGKQSEVFALDGGGLVRPHHSFLPEEKRMKRSVVVVTLLVMFLAAFLWTVDAWARAGGGGSSGSRGSRSYFAPVRPPPSHSAPSLPPARPSSFQQPAQRSGWMGGLMGGIGGFFLGGLIGSMLFGGMGSGLFGGVGLNEILIVGGFVCFYPSYLRV